MLQRNTLTIRIAKALLASLLFLSSLPVQIAMAEKLPAMALHDDPKYLADFQHFDYVNPNAPKGGTVTLAEQGSFDSLNPYLEKGTPAKKLTLIYDTLMTGSADEPFSVYPLVAQYAEPQPDGRGITFHLNPNARFHDGTQITASDVRFSLNLLRTKASPFFRAYYSDVESVEVLSQLSVRFTFKKGSNPELPLILSQLPILPEHFWKKEENDFTAATLTRPLGSGPYQIGSIDPGRSITYERVEDYWGKDLPVNRGRYNFDRQRYDYYRDSNVALEALKAGQYNLRFENIARNWATAYNIPAVEDGRLKLKSVSTLTPQGMQGFIFNLRRDIFKDVRVRKALNYAMDFEWLNKNLFYNSYKRTGSYYTNSEMEATGLPEGMELERLEPWRHRLPEELFEKPFQLPTTDGTGRMRSQLGKALKLMGEAGWKLEKGLLQKEGKPFKFEILLYDSSFEKVANHLKNNLRSMGIDVSVRTIDLAQYVNRLRQFDFDMVVARYPQTSSPGNEQRDYWGSHFAKQPGSRNLIGVNDPVVDELVDGVIRAESREELVSAVRALDRVLLYNWYMIPHWYLGELRIAYWKPLAFPQTAPLYTFDIDNWWLEPGENQTVETTHSEKWPSGAWLLSGLGLTLIALFFVRRRRTAVL